jgi:hypothetical protein
MNNNHWERRIPARAQLQSDCLGRIEKYLEEIRTLAKQMFDDRHKHIALENVRVNLLLPEPSFCTKLHFPGQLVFVRSLPREGYSPIELGNRFSPGEGVSGRVFLEGSAKAEDGKVGVSSDKLSRMDPKLAAVAGFPLLDQDSQNAFGVVCVDFTADPGIDRQLLDDLLVYQPLNDAVVAIASELQHCDGFTLQFSARSPPQVAAIPPAQSIDDQLAVAVDALQTYGKRLKPAQFFRVLGSLRIEVYLALGAGLCALITAIFGVTAALAPEVNRAGEQSVPVDRADISGLMTFAGELGDRDPKSWLIPFVSALAAPDRTVIQLRTEPFEEATEGINLVAEPVTVAALEAALIFRESPGKPTPVLQPATVKVEANAIHARIPQCERGDRLLILLRTRAQQGSTLPLNPNRAVSLSAHP